MTVARILRGKSPDVVTVAEQNNLRDVASILASRKIGALVVTDAGRSVLGIISERDLVRAIAGKGPAALDAPVHEWMTRKVVTTTEEAAINSTMQMMTSGRFRHLPVVREGKLVGVISIGDVVKSHIEAIEHEYRALQDYIHA